MQSLPLRQSILKTMSFFALFDQPLTKEEVHRYLWRNTHASLSGVEKMLEEMVHNETIFFEQGLYALKSGLAPVRLARIALLEEKMKIAKTAARWLRWVPFVDAVFVCNNVALQTVSPESDVDVFIIAREGRIWLARLFATVLLRVRHIGRTKRQIEDKICLSFYITPEALDLRDIRIDSPDVYLSFWVRSLFPLYDPDNWYARIQRTNRWVHSYLRPQYTFVPSRLWRVQDSAESLWVTGRIEQVLGSRFGDRLEEWSRHLQQSKMKRNRESVQDAPDSRVIVSDTMLKFHENDRRAQYKDEWQAMYETYAA